MNTVMQSGHIGMPLHYAYIFMLHFSGCFYINAHFSPKAMLRYYKHSFISAHSTLFRKTLPENWTFQHMFTCYHVKTGQLAAHECALITAYVPAFDSLLDDIYYRASRHYLLSPCIRNT